MPSSAVLMAPASARNIFPPSSMCFTHPFAASSVSRALKCLKFSSRKFAMDITRWRKKWKNEITVAEDKTTLQVVKRKLEIESYFSKIFSTHFHFPFLRQVVVVRGSENFPVPK